MHCNIFKKCGWRWNIKIGNKSLVASNKLLKYILCLCRRQLKIYILIILPSVTHAAWTL